MSHLGWYEVAELIRKFDFNKIIFKDIIFYAKSDEKLYIVAFDTNDGNYHNDQLSMNHHNIGKYNTLCKIGWYEVAFNN